MFTYDMQIWHYLEVCSLKYLYLKHVLQQEDKINLGSEAIGKGKFWPKLKREIMKEDIIEFINFIWFSLQKNWTKHI